MRKVLISLGIATAALVAMPAAAQPGYGYGYGYGYNVGGGHNGGYRNMYNSGWQRGGHGGYRMERGGHERREMYRDYGRRGHDRGGWNRH